MSKKEISREKEDHEEKQIYHSSKTRIKKHVLKVSHSVFWFAIGFSFSAMCLASILLLWFDMTYQNRVIPGVYVDNIAVGGKTQQQIQQIYDAKNVKIDTINFEFTLNNTIATVSAKTLGIGYDSKLAAIQSMSVGKSPSVASNVYTILSAYMNGISLKSSYTYNEDALHHMLIPLEKSIHQDPVDAQFQVQNNRVVAFKESQDGETLDYDAIDQTIRSKIPGILRTTTSSPIIISLAVKDVKPNVSTKEANNFGIVEEIGEGSSHFGHSAPERIHNVALAASRVSGVLVAPGAEFSFDKYLGDVSAYTGYQQAYIISNGHTVLGDGGGVCQVSTTLFRAILNAGLPITERHAHAYRVGYYEEDSPPGFDATVYYPTVDLKFKNDTGNYILVQSSIDLDNLELTYTLYGKSDGRQVAITTPVVTNQRPAPAPLYQDDPTLPVGTVKQTDFAANGATVKFSRTVTKNGKPYIQDAYTSNYAPWQAVFLRGTKTS